MYKTAQLFLLHCQTPLHAGSGEAHSYIDLPIQRERHTRFPKVEGSSLKGAIREAAEEIKGVPVTKAWDVDINRLFGKDENPDSSASLGFSDARLLLFPVRSAFGVMAWITCPMVLQKFVKEYNLVHPDKPLAIDGMPQKLKDNEVLAGPGIMHDNKIVLEEYLFLSKEFEISINQDKPGVWLSNLLFEKESKESVFFQERFAIVSDEVFREFTERFTIVITRNKIDNETGAVAKGALFSVEYLPDESVMYHFVTASDEFTKNPVRKSAAQNMEDFLSLNIKVIQLGGDMTIGKGIITISKI